MNRVDIVVIVIPANSFSFVESMLPEALHQAIITY